MPNRLVMDAKVEVPHLVEAEQEAPIHHLEGRAIPRASKVEVVEVGVPRLPEQLNSLVTPYPSK